MTVSEIADFIINDGPKVAQAILLVIGGLKVLARYTTWKWDDHLFDWIAIPFKKPAPPPKKEGD